jgi:hypothetical protein
MPRRAVSNRGQLPKPSGYFVYCYLRTDSNRPYYIGQGSRPDRMTAKHACKVPTDRSRIRVLREGLTAEEADRWEIFYIERFGRKADGGCLVNHKEGGRCGGNDEETKARISAKVIELHAQGVFGKLNAPETAKRRAFARAANKAAEFGIPEDAYLAMSKSQRQAAKVWCRANPDRPFSEYVPKTMEARKARTAATRGIPADVYAQMSRKEQNALRMWLEINPGCTGADYLAGVRKRSGPASRLDRHQVFALRAKGKTHGEIAKVLGCGQSHITRILSGKRCAA